MSPLQPGGDPTSRRTNSNSQSDPHASGLMRAVRDTGRIRGSAATPTPADQQKYQEQLNKLQSMTLDPSPQKSQYQTPPNRNLSFANQGLHDRQLSSTSSTTLNSYAVSPDYSEYPSSQMTAYRQPQPSSGNSSQPFSAPNFSRQFHSSLKAISDQLSPPLNHQLNRIGREVDDAINIMVQEKDQTASERDNAYSEIKDLNGKLHATIQDRDRYSEQRDATRRQINELTSKHQQAEEDWSDTESQMRRTIETQANTITFQEEQLKGKRALWMEKHPESSAQRAAMTARDPFDSPTPSQSAGFDNNFLTVGRNTLLTLPVYSSSSFGGQSSGAPVGAPRGPKRQGGPLPTGKALSCAGNPHTSFIADSTSPPSEAGSSNPPLAVAVVVAAEVLAPEFQARIGKVYGLIEGWTKIYANTPNRGNDSAIARSNDKLWAYMLDLTYPGQRQSSHSHVTALLDDQNSRHWFVMRMAVTYVCRYIYVFDVFATFDEQSQNIINEVKAKLQERGLEIGVRQKYIDKIVGIVEKITTSPDYDEYRNDRIRQHSKRLRDMLSPLLNQEASREDAGRDLGAIVIQAFETTVKMWSSRLQFQINFPETGAKFVAASMIAKDQPRADPMQLQIRQQRIKLAITPVVTMRDDRGTTIKAKNLHLSSVLTMV